MNLYDLRKDSGMAMTRRIPYPFSAIEWRENYPAGRKSNRPVGNRRNHERRSVQRRQRHVSELLRAKKYPANLLTREERELIDFLNRSEEESPALS